MPERTAESTAIDWYDAHAYDVANGYEHLDAHELYRWAEDLLPAPGASAADIGAGTGRDATWLAQRGYRTTAVVPSATMRRIGRARHRGSPVEWLDDQLPELPRTRRLPPFDLVVLNAVWMHAAPDERAGAVGSILAATKPGGLVLVSLRHGPAPPERRMHPCTAREIAELARARGAAVVRTATAGDQRERPSLRWTQIALRRDAEAGAAT